MALSLGLEKPEVMERVTKGTKAFVDLLGSAQKAALRGESVSSRETVMRLHEMGDLMLILEEQVLKAASAAGSDPPLPMVRAMLSHRPAARKGR